MSNFDIAIGFNASTLNSCSTALFGEPAAQDKYFKGTYSATQPNVGTITFTYQVLAAPIFLLEAPTQANWDASIKKKDVTTMPAQNLFQLQIPNIRGSAVIAPSPTPVVAEGPLTVYLTVTQTGVSLKLTAVAVLIDETKFSKFDKWLVNNVLAPAALHMADGMLTAFTLPAIPSYDGVTINTPSVFISQSMVVAAATIQTNTLPLDVSGYTWQQKNCFAVISPLLLNTLFKGALAPYQNYSKSDSASEGNDFAWAKGSYSATIKTVTAALKSDPTKVDISVTGEASASGSFGGIGPAMACPIGAALSAM